MKRLPVYIIISFILLLGNILKAEHGIFHVIHYSTQYNLPTDLIKDVNKDDKGGYFMATDEGCYWFLGREYYLLKTLPDKSTYFKHFMRKRDGSLLVISDDALYQIDYNTEGPYLNFLLGKGRSINDSLPFYYKSLYEDDQGAIWIADNRHLYSLDGGQLKKYKMDKKNQTTSYERSFQFLSFPNNRFAAISQ